MANAIIHNPKEIKAMRLVGQLAADTLVLIEKHIRPGVTTAEINRIVHDYTLEHGARPAPLNYKGFPASVCTSVNEVVCHGIPEERELKDGDIVNVDVTSVLPARGGFHGDTSKTFYVGEPAPLTRHVVEVARTCLEIGIRQVRPGGHIGDIGAAISAYATQKGCSVVEAYTGHGIGRTFHGPPNVSHVGVRGTGTRMKRGMTFTIEPMINLGTPDIDHLDDGWTVVTRDGALSAQFEHTVVVTRNGVEILTLPTDWDGPRRLTHDPDWRP